MRHLIWLLLVIAPITAQAQDPVPSLYPRVQAAAIEVVVQGHLEGSGVIIDPTGYALTASHVVESYGRRVEVRTSKGRVGAQRIALDLGQDLALLKLDKTPDGTPWPALPLAARAPTPGSSVFLYGAPIYRHAMLLRGMIARGTPAYEYLGNMQRYHRTMHVSGVAPPGTSGGPWLDAKGHVVGIQSGVMNNNAVPVGIAYAAPTDGLRTLVTRRADVPTTTLGVAIEELWEQPADFVARYPEGTEGLRVTYIFQPSACLGLQKGDLIVKINDHPTPLRDALLEYVRAQAPGAKAVVTVRRGAEVLRLPVVLGTLTARL